MMSRGCLLFMFCFVLRSKIETSCHWVYIRNLICTEHRLNYHLFPIVGFQQVKRLFMSRPFILFLWCRQIGSEEKGGGEVKHREQLRETYALGHNSFSMRWASRGEQSRIPWNCRNMQRTVLYAKSESCLRSRLSVSQFVHFISESHCVC